MGNPILDALGFVGNVLDTPGSTVRGLGAAAFGSGDWQRALAGILDPSQRYSGREMLGFGKGEEGSGLDLGDVAGFGAEMATDPLNLLGGYMAHRMGKASRMLPAVEAEAAPIAQKMAASAPEVWGPAMDAAGHVPGQGAMPNYGLPMASREMPSMPSGGPASMRPLETPLRDMPYQPGPGYMPRGTDPELQALLNTPQPAPQSLQAPVDPMLAKFRDIYETSPRMETPSPFGQPLPTGTLDEARNAYLGHGGVLHDWLLEHGAYEHPSYHLPENQINLANLTGAPGMRDIQPWEAELRQMASLPDREGATSSILEQIIGGSEDAMRAGLPVSEADRAAIEMAQNFNRAQEAYQNQLHAALMQQGVNPSIGAKLEQVGVMPEAWEQFRNEYLNAIKKFGDPQDWSRKFEKPDPRVFLAGGDYANPRLSSEIANSLTADTLQNNPLLEELRFLRGYGVR